jgi:hypothetical protein
MTRSRTLVYAAAVVAATLTVSLSADVKTRQRTHVKIEGFLGKMFNLFGGKGAREGFVSTVAVKGDRKSMISDNSGQIVDLSEEKVYDLDLKKKEYRVTTFEELRRRIKEQQERAAEEARKEEGRQEKPEEGPRKEWEFDFKADETGQKKQIAGYDTRQVIMTVTMREKGKALEEGGGVVMTADTWFGPDIPALKELVEFERRYFEKLYGADVMGLAADQAAMIMAMYPMLKDANDRLKQEGAKLQGTALMTTTTFEAVKSKAALEQEASQQNQGGGGGLGGMLARKVMKKDPPKPRALIFTATNEYQEVATSTTPGDLEIPAGFKEKK